jgi:hypothetical protein
MKESDDTAQRNVVMPRIAKALSVLFLAWLAILLVPEPSVKEVSTRERPPLAQPIIPTPTTTPGTLGQRNKDGKTDAWQKTSAEKLRTLTKHFYLPEVNLDGVPVEAALQQIWNQVQGFNHFGRVELGRLKIVLDPGVGGVVTLKQRGITLFTALAVIAAQTGRSVVFGDDVVTLALCDRTLESAVDDRVFFVPPHWTNFSAPESNASTALHEPGVPAFTNKGHCTRLCLRGDFNGVVSSRSFNSRCQVCSRCLTSATISPSRMGWRLRTPPNTPDHC